jgi:hypothetical protein
MRLHPNEYRGFNVLVDSTIVGLTLTSEVIKGWCLEKIASYHFYTNLWKAQRIAKEVLEAGEASVSIAKELIKSGAETEGEMNGINLKITNGESSPFAIASPIFTPAIQKIISDALKQATEDMHKMYNESNN